jgi:hypothetical protein
MSNPMRKLAIVVMVFLLAGCAAETYGPKDSLFRSMAQSGYKDKQIDKETWEVEYSGANYNYKFVYNWAVRRSAEIAKREGFPYFSVTKIGDQQAPVYSGDKYVGAMVYITLRMRGWRAYEERCNGDQIVRSSLRCDLYDTERTLASWKE